LYASLSYSTLSHLQYALGRDGFGDRASDGLGGVDESLLRGHALLHVSAEKTLHDGMDGSEEDSTLAVDVRLKYSRRGELKCSVSWFIMFSLYGRVWIQVNTLSWRRKL
jgi:hypothetical protein